MSYITNIMSDRQLHSVSICRPVVFFLLLLSSAFGCSHLRVPTTEVTRTETIFDRVVTIEQDYLEVPQVDRLESSLGLVGRHVEVNGARLWVEVEGSGVPVVLVPGGPGTSHHYFHPYLAPMAAFARVIYFDPRGVGLSERGTTSAYSVDLAVDDLDKLREALGIEQWVMLGYSFGGTVAQRYALKYPDRLLGLVLASSTVPMSVDVGLLSRQLDYLSEAERQRIGEIYQLDGQRVIPVHTDQISPAAAARMLYNGFMNGDWKRRHMYRMSSDDIARYALYEFVHDRDYYAQMVADGTRFDLSGCFHDFPVPTLLLEGRWDLAFGDWKPAALHREFPRAHLVVLPEAGHALFEDDPSGFFGAIEPFIGGVRAPTGRAVELWRHSIAERALCLDRSPLP